MTERLSDLDALVELSRHMLAKARAGEWDDMAMLEQQRFDWLKIALEAPVSAAESAEVAARLEAILALDRETIALAAAARDESAAQAQRLRQGQLANNAYATVDRS